MKNKKLKLWIKYENGREFIDYCDPSVVPESVRLEALLREIRRNGGQRVVDSKWEYMEAAE